MSRLYDTAEPSLVDEELLQKAVEEQGPQDQAGQIAKEEGIQYDEVCQLRLDYKSKTFDRCWCSSFICILFGADMSCPLSTERRAIVAVEIVFIPYFVHIFNIFVHRHPEDWSPVAVHVSDQATTGQ